MIANLPNKIVEEIQIFARERQIAKVVLFGSRARGTNEERSDVDIAAIGGDFGAFYWTFKNKSILC